MRFFYTLLFYLSLPYVFFRLAWRSLRVKAYRERWGERLGFYPKQLDKCIWIHAVSVGETIAAIPLIKALKKQHPHLPLLVTTMTPTGAARVQDALGNQVIHAYIPYDLPYAVNLFLLNFNPLIAIIMETELWPNLLSALNKKKIPTYLINARLSEKSAKGYQRISKLTKDMLRSLTAIATHAEADAKRFINLGANPHRVMVTGSIKYDLELPKDLAEKSQTLRLSLGKNRFVWIAASTHEGEENILLTAHKELLKQFPHALLILVPRHPDRFETIAKLCEQMFVTKRRSKNESCTDDTHVFLGDTMGELLVMYGAADVAFVAGSLIPRGGHNILEPAALGKPILTGTHLFNFKEMSDLFYSEKALIKVTDQASLVSELTQLITEPTKCEQMGERAHQLVMANRGALAKQLALVNQGL